MQKWRLEGKLGWRTVFPSSSEILQNFPAAEPTLVLGRVTAQYTNTEHQQGKDKGFDTWGLRWQVAMAIFTLMRSCCRGAQAGHLSWLSSYHSVSHLTELQDKEFEKSQKY